jgi:hypothetical protein
MNRREALKKVAMIMGGALSSSTISAVLSGCGPGTGKWSPKALTGVQNELIATITELIIPTTDTPGARAAKVNEFVDLMLADWFTTGEKSHFLQGLVDVDTRANGAYKAPFLECTMEQQVSLLRELEQEALKTPPVRTDSDDNVRPFFLQIKELTLIGYYTSEIGASQELKYFHGAMQYDGCVPFSEVGRTWSS